MFEKSVIFNIVHSFLHAAVALRHICHEEMFHKRFRVGIKIFWEFDLAFQNVLVNLHWVVSVERIDSSDHFVGQYSKGPPVDWL